MLACDVMARNVITVSPNAGLAEIADLMLKHRVSGLPVLDNGTLVGIVTESDLLRRVETGTEVHHSRLAEFFTSAETLAHEYTKSHGKKAAHLMSPSVVVVQADTPLAEVAEVLAANNIKRVPVMLNGKLVGIISRANLVQALASQGRFHTEADTNDRQIRERLQDELRDQPWAESQALYNIVVEDGTVHLWGIVRTAAEREATIVAAENIPGVKKVVDHLTLPRHVAA